MVFIGIVGRRSKPRLALYFVVLHVVVYGTPLPFLAKRWRKKWDNLYVLEQKKNKNKWGRSTRTGPRSQVSLVGDHTDLQLWEQYHKTNAGVYRNKILKRISLYLNSAWNI